MNSCMPLALPVIRRRKSARAMRMVTRGLSARPCSISQRPSAMRMAYSWLPSGALISYWTTACWPAALAGLNDSAMPAKTLSRTPSTPPSCSWMAPTSSSFERCSTALLQRREVRGVDLAHAARPPCSAAVTRPRRPCPRSLRDRTRRPQPGRRIHPGGRSWSAARARSRHGTPCAPGPGWSCTRRSPPATRPAWTPRSWRPWPRRPGGCAAPASRSPPATAPTPPTGGPPTTGVRPGPPPACSTTTSTGASTRSRSAGCAAASGTWSGTRAASSAAGWSSPGPSCTCTRDRWSGPPAMPPRRWRRPAPTATTTWPRSRCSSRGGPWSPPAASRRAWPCWTRP